MQRENLIAKYRLYSALKKFPTIVEEDEDLEQTGSNLQKKGTFGSMELKFSKH